MSTRTLSDFARNLSTANPDGGIGAEADDFVQKSELGAYQPAGAYATADHLHNGVYQPSGDYALTTHNHDGVYAPVDHVHASPEIIDGTGAPVLGAKIACYSATTDGSGNVNIDISSAGFANILSLLATGEGGDGTAENTPHASVVSHTNTSVTVKTLESAGGGGLLVSVVEGMQDSPNRLVYLTVIGT